MARNTSTTDYPRGPLTRLGILSIALSLGLAISSVTSVYAGDGHGKEGKGGSGSEQRDGDHSPGSHGGGTAAPGVTSTGTAVLKAAHVGATNPGFGTGSCPTPPVAGYWGWHFVLQGNNTQFTGITVTFEDAGVVTSFISQPTGKHAYVFTPTADALLGATATTTGTAPLDTEFVLSHVCGGSSPVVLDSTPTPTPPASTPAPPASTPTVQSTPTTPPPSTPPVTFDPPFNPPSNPPQVISSNPPAHNPPAVNKPVSNRPAPNKPAVDKPVDPIDMTAGARTPGALSIPSVPATGNTALTGAESGRGLPSLGLLLTGIGAAAMVISRKKARQ